MPEEFWRLTNAEFGAKVRGFMVLNDLRSADHRNLFTLMLNLNRRKGTSPKLPSDVWGLMIDDESKMKINDRLDWYKKIGKNSKK